MEANLVLLAKGGKQKTIALPSTVTVIGRRHNCDLRIPLDAISRRHCQLTQEDANLVIRDLGSRNGTFLNGKKVEQEPLKAGDVIRLGPVTFALQIDGQPNKIAAPSEPKAPASKDGPAADDTDLDLGGDASGLDELDAIDDLDLDDL